MPRLHLHRNGFPCVAESESGRVLQRIEVNGMRRYVSRIFCLISELAPAPDAVRFAREWKGSVLSQEPIVRVLTILLANNLRLCFRRDFAGRILLVAEDGALGCLLSNCSLIHEDDFFGELAEMKWNVV